MSMKNFNGTIRNQTHDFPACSIVTEDYSYKYMGLYVNINFIVSVLRELLWESFYVYV